jgi:peptidoglycan/LPS O-acetylase OafA/YrhL
LKHSNTNYRKDVQVLRGLAVLAVLLFHCYPNLFPLGYLGVDVFFVISGFVVTPLILRIPTDSTDRNSTLLSGLSNFYKRRFFRLAPALTASLMMSAILVFLLLPPTSHERFARQGIATLLLLGNLGAYEYSGDYFHPNPNPLIHTWSLSVEEQIYFALPLILLLFLTSNKRRGVFLLLVFITVFSFTLSLGVIETFYSRLGIENEVLFSFYSPINRIWQFTLGGLGFLILDRYPNLLGAFFKRTNLFFNHYFHALIWKS